MGRRPFAGPYSDTSAYWRAAPGVGPLPMHQQRRLDSAPVSDPEAIPLASPPSGRRLTVPDFEFAVLWQVNVQFLPLGVHALHVDLQPSIFDGASTLHATWVRPSDQGYCPGWWHSKLIISPNCCHCLFLIRSSTDLNTTTPARVIRSSTTYRVSYHHPQSHS